jgi:hypothetical protein
VNLCICVCLVMMAMRLKAASSALTHVGQSCLSHDQLQQASF